VIDRRPTIEKYLPPGWVIVQPAPNNPGYIDDQCVFQKPDEYKEATARLPVKWFLDKDCFQIRTEIQRAIEQAEVKI